MDKIDVFGTIALCLVIGAIIFTSGHTKGWQDVVSKICPEIKWKSPTCETEKQRRLEP